MNRQPTPGQVEAVLDDLASISDRIGETIASLVDLERGDDFDDPDGLIAGKLHSVLLAVWRLRWEIGPCAGAVKVGKCGDCRTSEFHPVETNSAEQADGSAES